MLRKRNRPHVGFSPIGRLKRETIQHITRTCPFRQAKLRDFVRHVGLHEFVQWASKLHQIWELQEVYEI